MSGSLASKNIKDLFYKNNYKECRRITTPNKRAVMLVAHFHNKIHSAIIMKMRYNFFKAIVRENGIYLQQRR